MDTFFVIPPKMGANLRQHVSGCHPIVLKTAVPIRPGVENTEPVSRNLHTKFTADLQERGLQGIEVEQPGVG
jgi:hypothetical protein